jgi:15-cis-phytoene synthase
LSAEACAALVERGDPDRFRSAMVAPPAMRPGLMALYAFNLEIARAPWVASEPMLAQIRLRWWLDALEEIAGGGAVRRHEVVGPLAEAVRAGGLPVRLMEEMVEARVVDAEAAPHGDRAALDRYIERTAGHLMELAARHLGAGEGAVPVVRRFAYGAGVAAFLRAVPELRARGREPLPEGVAVAGLARDGLAALADGAGGAAGGAGGGAGGDARGVEGGRDPAGGGGGPGARRGRSSRRRGAGRAGRWCCGRSAGGGDRA